MKGILEHDTYELLLALGAVTAFFHEKQGQNSRLPYLIATPLALICKPR